MLICFPFIFYCNIIGSTGLVPIIICFDDAQTDLARKQKFNQIIEIVHLLSYLRKSQQKLFLPSCSKLSNRDLSKCKVILKRMKRNLQEKVGGFILNSYSHIYIETNTYKVSHPHKGVNQCNAVKINLPSFYVL